jgi:hypothetical protein
MAKCAYCGAETSLYSFGTPVCLDCVATRQKGDDPKREPPRPKESLTQGPKNPFGMD